MTDSLEYTPWSRTGPDRSYLWDWSRQELRDQLQPGMILETYDCGYICVHAIDADGVIERRRHPSGELTEPHHWSWEALSRYECTIYRHADDGGPA